MKTYFTLNSTLYNSDAAKIMTTLNKMSSRGGAPYIEIWYNKMADISITNSEKTFNKFIQNFESTFYPFYTKATSYTELSKLIQRSFKKDDETVDDGFQCYITDFQNLPLKTGIKDELYLINQFSLRVDQKIASMILSMTNVPTTNSGWIDQAKIFHAQKMQIVALQAG